MKKIALIIPYIGRVRNDFGFWLKSVENNPTIDFQIFTDSKIENSPSNVKVFNFSFEELKNLIQKNFDFPVVISKPYKFCDFRPAYGEIFQDYLKEYDFWGYTDMDIVYGNLRKYITDELLDSYDHIFGRGHLSLYRNTVDVNSIYRNVDIPTYKQVFTYDEGRAFDEYCGTSTYWVNNLSDRFFESICFDDIDCMEYPFISQMRRKEYSGCKNIIYSYEDGTLYRIYEKDGKINKYETMYVHFQKREMNINTAVEAKFIMIPNSYEPYEEITSLSRLQTLGHRPNFYPQRYKLKWKDFKSKFHKLYLKYHPSIYGFPMLPKAIDRFYKED